MLLFLTRHRYTVFVALPFVLAFVCVEIVRAHPKSVFLPIGLILTVWYLGALVFLHVKTFWSEAEQRRLAEELPQNTPILGVNRLLPSAVWHIFDTPRPQAIVGITEHGIEIVSHHLHTSIPWEDLVSIQITSKSIFIAERQGRLFHLLSRSQDGIEAFFAPALSHLENV